MNQLLDRMLAEGPEAHPGGRYDMVVRLRTLAETGTLHSVLQNIIRIWFPPHLTPIAKYPTHNDQKLHMIVSCMRLACRYGQLGVAQWLHQTYHLDVNDARLNNYYALWTACKYGHLDVVQWLYNTFQIDTTFYRVHEHKNFAFRHACEGAQLHVMQWLYETFNMRAEDTIAPNDGSPPHAICYKAICVRRWLFAKFGLSWLIPKLKWLPCAANLDYVIMKDVLLRMQCM